MAATKKKARAKKAKRGGAKARKSKSPKKSPKKTAKKASKKAKAKAKARPKKKAASPKPAKKKVAKAKAPAARQVPGLDADLGTDEGDTGDTGGVLPTPTSTFTF